MPVCGERGPWGRGGDCPLLSPLTGSLYPLSEAGGEGDFSTLKISPISSEACKVMTKEYGGGTWSSCWLVSRKSKPSQS